MRALTVILLTINLSFVITAQDKNLCPLTKFDSDWSKEICLDYKSENGYNNLKDNSEAIAYVQRLMKMSGLPMNYIVSECQGIKNAFAYTYDGVQYIFYGKEFLESLNSEGNDIASITVLAHEIGHHLSGHTSANSYINKFCKNTECLNQSEECLEAYKISRDRELQADTFAGFIMSKIGAKKEDVKDTFRKLYNNEENNFLCSTHPSLSDRLEAIDVGFSNSTMLSDSEQYNGSEFHYSKALSLFKQGKKMEGYKELDDIIKNDPYFGAAYILKSDELIIDGNNKAAIKTCEAASEVNPNFAGAFLQLSDIYSDEGDYEKSKIAAEKALSLNSQNPSDDFYAYGDIANYYRAQKDFKKTIEYKIQQLDILKKNLEDLKTSGHNYVAPSEYDFIDLHVRIGHLFRESNLLKDAAQYYELAIPYFKLYENRLNSWQKKRLDAEMYYFLGYVNYKLGKSKDQSCNYMKKACSTNPDLYCESYLSACQ